MKNFFYKYKLNYVFLFFIAFFFFFWLQNSQTFADPDSFYHAKMALLMKDQGIIQNFPWLQFTTLKNLYIDHHLLYHVFLIPFVIFGDPLFGTKLAAISFAALLITVIYWFLRRFKIKGSIFYCLLLLLINPFIFRINLAKAPVLSSVFLILALFFLFRRKIWPLFFISFFYVWLYGGWPLMLVFTIIFLVVDTINNLWQELNPKKPEPVIENNIIDGQEIILIKSEERIPAAIGFREFIVLFLARFFSGINLKLLIANVSGLVIGLVVNPYFPKNLFFYWEQTIKIGLINAQNTISVGAEWYPYKLFDFVSGANLIFILLLLALTMFIVGYKKQNIYSWTLFFISLFFFIFTLKSRRNVEYFVPFVVIFSAFSLSKVFQYADFHEYRLWFKKLPRIKKFLSFILVVYMVTAIVFISTRDVLSARKDLTGGFAWSKMEKASQWLVANTPQGSIVFNNNWDEFPSLFYYNAHNYYIVGLDPTFMYDYNKDLYWEWYNIVVGKDKENLNQKVKNDFKASYVLWATERTKVEDSFAKSAGFKLIYSDDEAKIYQVL
jgi:hypothetical protein